MIVEDEWEQKMKKKDEEIEKLKASAVGNAMAYHEALWDILDVVNGVHHEELIPRSVRDSIEKIVFDADNTPARNCDVGAPKEQRVRFITWCENHNLECEDCPLRAFRDSGDCGFAWMQMPYKNEESDASISR